jgi:uncharacterized protein involved in copper resistance
MQAKQMAEEKMDDGRMPKTKGASNQSRPADTAHESADDKKRNALQVPATKELGRGVSP